mmetsp:Transcript_32007/g.73065  ORF Transcript_32007/g.73065 Transcript_32007/m.73065 type:complete len:145 (+) Transcript_32007:31-465(+)
MPSGGRGCKSQAVELESASPMMICGLTALSRAGFATVEDVASMLRDTPNDGLPDTNKAFSPLSARRSGKWSSHRSRRPSIQGTHAQTLSLKETEHMLAVALMGPMSSQLPTARTSATSIGEASVAKAAHSNPASAARCADRIFL